MESDAQSALISRSMSTTSRTILVSDSGVPILQHHVLLLNMNRTSELENALGVTVARRGTSWQPTLISKLLRRALSHQLQVRFYSPFQFLILCNLKTPKVAWGVSLRFYFDRLRVDNEIDFGGIPSGCCHLSFTIVLDLNLIIE